MLKNKSEGSQNAQCCEATDANVRNSSSDKFGFIELTSVPKLFPVAPDYVGGNSRITGGQIPRTDQTITNEATAGQVSGLGSIGEHASIARWCGCSPSTDSSEVSLEGERVLRIYPLNSAPVEAGALKQIIHHDALAGHLDTGIPEQEPGQIAKPEVDPAMSQNLAERPCCQGNKASHSENDSNNGHNLTRSRPQSIGNHVLSLTQVRKLEGSCC